MSTTNFSHVTVSTLTIATTILTSTLLALPVNAQEQFVDLSELERSADLLVISDSSELSPEATETETKLSNEQPQTDNPKTWSIVPHVSTLGIGGSLVGKINPHLNGRVGINAFGFDLDYEETRGSYDSEVNLFNVTTALDYYPFKKSGFHTSLGVVYSNNNADGVASASDVFDVNLGGFIFGIDDLVDLNADVETSRNFAPYLGIGWGNPISRNLGLWANLGVMFPGSPRVELAPNYKFDPDILPANLRQDIQDALDEEERAIEEDLDRFNVYPIISVGLSYSF